MLKKFAEILRLTPICSPRMYQPELGRFLQPDPQEFTAGDYNLYRYCHNDPVNNSDPTGMAVDRIWDKEMYQFGVALI
jgi:uncharacterized protein RhaS with RHS repeats